MKKIQKLNPISTEDKNFFQEFYKTNRRFIFYTARKYVATQFECEDIVQETILRLIRNISTLRELNRCKTAYYIVLTVRSVYLDSDIYKNLKLQVQAGDNTLETMQEYMPSGQGSEQNLLHMLEINLLKNRLTEKEWMLLYGRYFLGYSDEELSRSYGCTPDSIRMALARARKKARALLEDDKTGSKGGEENG